MGMPRDTRGESDELIAKAQRACLNESQGVRDVIDELIDRIKELEQERYDIQYSGWERAMGEDL